MLKWLGAGLVICGCAAIGASMTGDLRRRVLQLQEMRKMVVALQGEIRYGNAALNVAFRRVAHRTRQPFRSFLECMAIQMEECRGEALTEIFRQSVKEELKGTSLRASDLELLERLGESMGYLDVKTQMDSMDLFLEQVGRLCQEAEGEYRNKSKVYHYLGVSVGLFLAIILI